MLLLLPYMVILSISSTELEIKRRRKRVNKFAINDILVYSTQVNYNESIQLFIDNPTLHSSFHGSHSVNHLEAY